MKCKSKIRYGFPTLTIRGFRVLCASGQATVVQQFDWGNALIDAIITSAITFFSTLGGVAATGIIGAHLIQSAIIAALSQFFVFLALKRGLVKSDDA
jgi:hypothetical protein